MNFTPGRIYKTDMGSGFTLLQGARTDTRGWTLLINEAGGVVGLTNDAWLTTTGRPTVELVPATGNERAEAA